MKPTENESYRTYGGNTLTQTCVVCGDAYRGENTIAWPIGNGVYRDFPCHAKCEEQHKRENQAG